MNYKRITLFILFVGTFLSCAKKKYPESVTLNEAVFFSTFSVDGKPVDLKAGVEGYYMYSAIKQDTHQIYNFIADLKKTDCQNCPTALKLVINDYKVSLPNSPVNIDSSLMVKDYSYLPTDAGASYNVSFTSSYNRVDAGATYFWNFGDGENSDLKDPVHTYAAAGNYEVCLTIKGSNSCQSSVCRKINVKAGGFNSSISSIATGGNAIAFSYQTSGGNPQYDFLWNFGDGQTTTQQNPTHTYPHSGAYGVSLRLTDALGDISIVHYNAVTKNDISSCAANFGTPLIDAVANDQAMFSKIIISYTDESGIVYHSNEVSQTSSSLFKIVSVENRGPNEKGELTKKLHVKFNCKVANGNKVKTINNGDAVIAVAYR